MNNLAITSIAALFCSLLTGCPAELKGTFSEDPECCCINTETGHRTMAPESKCNQSVQCGSAGESACRGASVQPQPIDLTGPLRVVAGVGFRFKMQPFDALQLDAPHPTQISLADCRASCKGEATDAFYCFVGKLTLPPSHADGVRYIQERLRTDGSTFSLAKVDTLSAFGYSKDPCERSDTLVIDGVFRNVGAACSAALSCSDWDEASETCTAQPEHRFDLHVPNVVEGTISVDGDAERVDFTNPQRAPILVIDNSVEDPEWGGRVVSAHASRDGLTIAFPRSCARIVY